MKKKILLLDDDEGIVEAVSLTLEDAGHTVTTALTEKDFYKKLRSVVPDLILIDLLISGNDGRRICKKIKQDPKTKYIPVVIISAHPRAKEESANCGADGFLAKPFETTELLALTEKY